MEHVTYNIPLGTGENGNLNVCTGASGVGKGRIFVQCSSHRSRGALFRLLPENPIAFYSWGASESKSKGGIFLIPPTHLEQALNITGVTIANPKHEYFKCW